MGFDFVLVSNGVREHAGILCLWCFEIPFFFFFFSNSFFMLVFFFICWVSFQTGEVRLFKISEGQRWCRSGNFILKMESEFLPEVIVCITVWSYTCLVKDSCYKDCLLLAAGSV